MTKQTKLSIDWFKDKNEKQKTEIDFVIRNNPVLVQSILDILSRYEEEENRSETSSADYDSPSWAYKQADRNGAKRMVRKIKNLFSI